MTDRFTPPEHYGFEGESQGACIRSNTDEDGTTTIQWEANGRGVMLVILADGEAIYSVGPHYAMNSQPIEWPEGMKAALAEIVS